MGCLGGFAIPVSMTTICSVITKNISSDKYGTLLSVLGSVNVMSAMIANIIIRLISDSRSSLFTGVVFGLTGISATSLVVVILTYIFVERGRVYYNELS